MLKLGDLDGVRKKYLEFFVTFFLILLEKLISEGLVCVFET